MLETVQSFVESFLHIDKQLASFVTQYGSITYLIIFLIIFAETGFVVTPFLPGDSLLFAAGAIAAIGSLNIGFIIALLVTAAVVGDAVNYWIGHFFGQKIVDSPKITFINQGHIDKTEAFYKKHGSKTIVLARFVPIVRTFAPFIAGIGKMHYRTFFIYNVTGALIWVLVFSLLGYFFGNIPFVADHFSYVIIAIIALSVFPIGMEFMKSRKHKIKSITEDSQS